MCCLLPRLFKEKSCVVAAHTVTGCSTRYSLLKFYDPSLIIYQVFEHNQLMETQTYRFVRCLAGWLSDPDAWGNSGCDPAQDSRCIQNFVGLSLSMFSTCHTLGERTPNKSDRWQPVGGGQVHNEASQAQDLLVIMEDVMAQ